MVGKRSDRRTVRRQRLRQGRAEPVTLRRQHPHPVALQRVHGRQRPQLPQALQRAAGQRQAGRIGPIDDVHVVVARQHQHALAQCRVAGQRQLALDPLGRAARIGHVAGDHHEVDRVLGVDRCQPVEHLCQPAIARRAGASAFDAQTVPFADHVDVRQMHDPRTGGPRRRLVERHEIAGLVHGGVGKPPDQRRAGHHGRNDRDRIGQRRPQQEQRRTEFSQRRAPARARPGPGDHRQRDGAGEQPSDRRNGGIDLRPPPGVAATAQQRLGQVPQPLAEHRIARLHRQRGQRPEALLDQAENGPSAEPAGHQDQAQQQQRPEADQRAGLARHRLHPGGGDQRRGAKRQPGQDDHQPP